MANGVLSKRFNTVIENAMDISVVREEDVDGKKAWIIPTIFTREGVMNKGFKPWEELSKEDTIKSLSNVPITFDHPNQPAALRPALKIGKALKVEKDEVNKTLRGEIAIWQDDPRAQWLFARLKEGKYLDGSVGFNLRPEYVSGTHMGKEYMRIERDLIFDHYAVGIEKGACSQPYCGLLLNGKDACDECSADAEHGLMDDVVGYIDTEDKMKFADIWEVRKHFVETGHTKFDVIRLNNTEKNCENCDCESKNKTVEPKTEIAPGSSGSGNSTSEPKEHLYTGKDINELEELIMAEKPIVEGTATYPAGVDNAPIAAQEAQGLRLRVEGLEKKLKEYEMNETARAEKETKALKDYVKRLAAANSNSFSADEIDGMDKSALDLAAKILNSQTDFSLKGISKPTGGGEFRRDTFGAIHTEASVGDLFRVKKVN